jgi:acyl-ACP thioesterase
VREVRRSRRVRLGDVGATGRLRLDALARYLQDVAWDDVVDAGVTDGRWVVRRIEIEVGRLPRFGDEIELATSCTGVGSRWARRRTRVTGTRAAVESSAIWVHLDAQGRPVPLDSRFASIWGEGLPRVSARLALPGPPRGAPARHWPLRASDVDALGHVNNAIAIAAVEDELAHLVADVRVRALQAEYRGPIEPGDRVTLMRRTEPDGLGVWLVVDGECRFSAQVTVDPSIS